MSQPSDTDPVTIPWEKIVRQAVHDMRTPLSSMLTTVAVLRQLQGNAAAPPQWERMIDLLERQVQTLSAQLVQLHESPESYLKVEESA
ncbi:histidine kinase dimerization/phospho-acceptor domain-containing protein [Luteolibacter soli]|uniref:histidine kinase n=1 Tax=Luteolibacter soli TaxID=3135280 RepID=A0ABU9AX71_9BACT